MSCYPQLEELNCEVCNLATLDLSNNKNLRLLRCNHNALTQLDLPTTLEHLECASNPLRELDTAGLPKLRVLHCDNAGLRSLDLRHNTELTELMCWSNALTRLDTSVRIFADRYRR